MNIPIQRKSPTVVAVLTVFSPQSSFDEAVLKLPLQTYKIENGILTVVAHRHTQQLLWIKPELEYKKKHEQPEIVCKIANEKHAWTYCQRRSKSA